MGRLITTLINSGAKRFVQRFAAEAAGIVPMRKRVGKRSIESLAVAFLRREFPGLEGSQGYYAARNVYRQQLRTAKATAREQERQNDRIDKGLSPVPLPPAGTIPFDKAEYTITVRLQSNRSQREFWTTVRVIDRAGMAYSEVAKLAREAVDTAGSYQTHGERKSQSVGSSWQVTEYHVLAETILP